MQHKVCLHALIFISQNEYNPISDFEILVYKKHKQFNPVHICLHVHCMYFQQNFCAF